MNQNVLEDIQGRSVANTARGKLVTIFVKSLKNENLQAIVILIITSLLFFSSPLLHYNDSYYASTDLTQLNTLTKIPGAPALSNGVLSDTVKANIPWSIFNRESLRKGEIPLWNPYNATGVPHLGNLQSAVFSPYMLPYYLFDDKLALIISAFLKLFAIGFFTYLFLKQIGLHYVASLVGAVIFMYCGFSIVWLGYTVTSALFILPAGLYFSEKIIAKALAPTSQKYYWWLVGLGVALACGVLAGHPETLYFSLTVIIAYILFRLYSVWSQNQFSREGLFQILRLSGQLIVAGLIGLGLSLFQLLTFGEYLLNSFTITERGSGLAYYPLQGNIWSLMYFPNLLGSSILPFKMPGNFNYTTTLGQYSGGLALLLAVLAVFYTWKNRYSRFFVGVLVVWLVYAYNPLDLGYWFQYLPGSGSVFPIRSQFVGLFCISVLSALFVHYLLENKVALSLRKQLFITAVVGILLLVQSLKGGQVLVQTTNNSMLHPELYKDYIDGHIWRIGLIYLLGLLLILVIPALKTALIKTSLALLLVMLIFFQTGFVLKDYNPITPNQTFYPLTENMKGLQKIAGSKTIAILNQDGILPSTNLMYKLHILPSYDSLWVKNTDELLKTYFSVSYSERLVNSASIEGLKLFGVDYILAASPDPFFNLDGSLADIMRTATKRQLLGEVLPGSPITQTFIARQNDLQTIKLALTSHKRDNKCNLSLELKDIEAAKTVATSTVICAAVRNEFVYSFSFPALANSSNRSYSLSITSADATENNSIGVYYKPDLNYPDGKLSYANKSIAGGLEFDLYAAGAKSFSNVGMLGPFNVWKFENSPSRYYTVSNAHFAASDKEALALLQSGSFDPNKQVVINANKPNPTQPVSPSSAIGKVDILAENNDSVQLKLQRTEPGYLVINTANFPGWHAYVNGKEQPLLKANYAFFGLEVGVGESVVELKYEPDSFKYGMYVTIATLVAIVGVGVWRRFFRQKDSVK